MKIKIDDTYSITNNSRNLMLQRRVDGEDKDGNSIVNYSTVGYFHSLNHLLQSYANEQLYQSEAQSFDELIEEMRATREVISSLTEEDKTIASIGEVAEVVKGRF